MKEINIGGQKMRVRATAPALFFYKKEFKCDLIGDLVGLSKISKDDISQLDTVALLQITWAMAKADAGIGNDSKFPSFETWLFTLEGIDLTDPDGLMKALEEAREGFFRRGTNQVKAKQKR